jgi:hypothetical protein
MKFLKWTDDKWLSRNGNVLPYDKLEHLLLNALGILILAYWIGLSVLASLIILELLGIAWEIKDGLIPYNDKGNIEGFSWKDLIANNVGLLMGGLFGYLVSI